MQARYAILITLLILLTACSPQSDAANLALQAPVEPTGDLALPSATPKLAETETPMAELAPTETLPPTTEPTVPPTPTEPFDPDTWRELPAIPEQLSPAVYEIYQAGQDMGRDPHAFSKVGDCNAVTPDFLGEFDLRPEYVKLGEYSHLQVTLDYFAGSYGRESLAAKVGQSAHSVMSPLHNDWKVCMPNETPLDCEFRVHNPAFAIISLGANDVGGYADFEESMRRVIENTIANGVVPILATKPDNYEGDHNINRTIAMLAYEYGVPLWNFWAAIQPLQDHGMLNGTSVHLSYSEISSWADFETPGSLDYGWTMRNLSAVQMLDAIREMILTYETAQN